MGEEKLRNRGREGASARCHSPKKAGVIRVLDYSKADRLNWVILERATAFYL